MSTVHKLFLCNHVLFDALWNSYMSVRTHRPRRTCAGEKCCFFFFYLPISAQVIIGKMSWKLLMGRLWFRNTSVDPGRPRMPLLPLSRAILLSLQSADSDHRTLIYILHQLGSPAWNSFRCAQICRLYVGWAGEGVSTQTTGWLWLVIAILFYCVTLWFRYKVISLVGCV